MIIGLELVCGWIGLSFGSIKSITQFVLCYNRISTPCDSLLSATSSHNPNNVCTYAGMKTNKLDQESQYASWSFGYGRLACIKLCG